MLVLLILIYKNFYHLYAKIVQNSPLDGMERSAGPGDSGDIFAGIPEEKMQAILDPFFTTQPPGQGTGLGLSVARKIIDLHHGSISVENRRSNPGVRVTIQLPLAGSVRGRL